MKVNFLLAEEVRAEINNKITILGLYAGDVVLILKGTRPSNVPENAPAALERLAILAVITDAPEGEHQFKGRIREPSGELPQPDFALGSAVVKKSFSHTVIIELKPFVVRQAGMFNFEFFVDETMFTFPFEIREEV